ncbi:MAG: hypothetical protein A2655_01075 [Candidatus Yanofskybacteria bacterium RIFCSPHIGHO2_01_FULL_43_42]|uniref:VWFA domain-containing protein n=1 Tax=Candidatus Yanofskybacteria bacterium RIFCSPLOWO2_01_FULL_43_22 TaxID=1802695 RepID=A0A1F8GEG7_9BACT|nr:MAG: hypothetical protein A2655_01075 [Candidatus Yanofskybacteria bacterium RIFCSPHIGHO2_01_FULL_43_42]OGN12402.1 MAG: hypothetical protein A3D48_01805 [Candidatus Yanofskybacteria bacterium RIFCSPHIGHO2_02_FULL_43_17]OGN23774.1 MAG: hypothetical protein A3A13_01865 [Candidatus Yanofskybacteria bacterium RIFCSPLOWO2_01_FULL_43_22]
MSNWLIWLDKITFAREQYFDFTALWLVTGVGILLVLVLKRLLRPKHARDSRQRIIGPDWVWLLSLALAGLMIVALAGPKIDTFKMLQSKDNLDIIIAVDKSVSMAVRDVGQSRHEVMMREIKTLISSPAVKDGDRLTLFAFSEKSNWRMPLSDDRDEFLDKLMEIEHPKDRIYYDRSQLYTYFAGLLNHIPKALEMQDKLFLQGRFRGTVNWTAYPRVIFIFSDGESIDDSLNIPLAKFAKLDIKTYTIGIGTSRGGVISIRVPEENNPNQLEPPRQIQSKLDMKALDLIKQKTGGKSYVVNNSSSQVQSFLISALAENRKPTLTLVPTGEAENFWWDFLAIPSLVIVSLMAIKFIRS